MTRHSQKHRQFGGRWEMKLLGRFENSPIGEGQFTGPYFSNSFEEIFSSETNWIRKKIWTNLINHANLILYHRGSPGCLQFKYLVPFDEVLFKSYFSSQFQIQLRVDNIFYDRRSLRSDGIRITQWPRRYWRSTAIKPTWEEVQLHQMWEDFHAIKSCEKTWKYRSF